MDNFAVVSILQRAIVDYYLVQRPIVDRASLIPSYVHTLQVLQSVGLIPLFPEEFSQLFTEFQNNCNRQVEILKSMENLLLLYRNTLSHVL